MSSLFICWLTIDEVNGFGTKSLIDKNHPHNYCTSPISDLIIGERSIASTPMSIAMIPKQEKTET